MLISELLHVSRGVTRAADDVTARLKSLALLLHTPVLGVFCSAALCPASESVCVSHWCFIYNRVHYTSDRLLGQFWRPGNPWCADTYSTEIS